MVYIGNAILFFGAMFSKRWALLRKGRQDTFTWLKTWQRPENKTIFWMHCASLGEYEQGRSIIEKIRKGHPNTYILLSFFSPSGFTNIRKDHVADHIFYLPADTKYNAKKITQIIDPDIFINVKYEFWWNILDSLTQTRTKVYLVSAVFRNGDYFFSLPFGPFKRILNKMEKIFVQDSNSAEILLHYGINKVVIAGDTRIDRVIQRAQKDDTPANVKILLKDKKVIVYGSVWISDLPVVNHCLIALYDYTHIIVPHDISRSNISTIKSELHHTSQILTEASEGVVSKIWIIDQIGLLSGLYRYARYAYVGGGFRKAIHNTLEPAAFHIPIFFGPNYKKFVEAEEMVRRKLATPVLKEEMARTILELDSNQEAYTKYKVGLEAYLDATKDATEKIINSIFP